MLDKWHKYVNIFQKPVKQKKPCKLQGF